MFEINRVNIYNKFMHEYCLLNKPPAILLICSCCLYLWTVSLKSFVFTGLRTFVQSRPESGALMCCFVFCFGCFVLIFTRTWESVLENVWSLIVLRKKYTIICIIFVKSHFNQWWKACHFLLCLIDILSIKITKALSMDSTEESTGCGKQYRRKLIVV